METVCTRLVYEETIYNPGEDEETIYNPGEDEETIYNPGHGEETIYIIHVTVKKQYIMQVPKFTTIYSLHEIFWGWERWYIWSPLDTESHNL